MTGSKIQGSTFTHLSLANLNLTKVQRRLVLLIGAFRSSPRETLRDGETKVIYHSAKTCGKFGWNVNGKMNFVDSPNGNFIGKTGFLEK